MDLHLADLQSHPYQDEKDLARLVALINQSMQKDGVNGSVTEEEMRLYLKRLDVERPQLWENNEGHLLLAVTMRIVIVYEQEQPSLEARLGFYVHPSVHNRRLEKQLIDWSLERTRRFCKERALPGTLIYRMSQQQAEHCEWLKDSGFTINRYFLTLERSLTQPLPEIEPVTGFTLRTGGSADVQAWTDLYNQSFIDHWHHHPVTIEQVQQELAKARYNPKYDLVAVAIDGTFAAFCQSVINQSEESRTKQSGWLDQLGTRRGFRKQGLGRWLLLESLRRLKAGGVDQVRLIVDAQSLTGAIRLYDSVGFQVYQTNHQYARPIL